MSEVNSVNTQNTNLLANDSADKFSVSVSQEQNAGYGLSNEDLKDLYANNSVDENSFGDEPFDNALALGPIALAIPAVVSWLSSPVVGAGVAVGGTIAYNALKPDGQSFEMSNNSSANPNDTGFQAKNYGQARSLDFPTKADDNIVLGFLETKNDKGGSEFPSIPNQETEVSGMLGNSEFGEADMKEAKSYWDRLYGDGRVGTDGTAIDGVSIDDGFVMRDDVDVIVRGGQVSLPGGGGFEEGALSKPSHVPEYWGYHPDEIKTDSVEKVLEGLAKLPEETIEEYNQRIYGETHQEFYKRMKTEEL